MLVEMLDGGVEEYLERKKGNEMAFRGIAVQMIEAVEEMHSTKHIHRDIRPSNFMLRNSNEVVLINFTHTQRYLTEEGVPVTTQGDHLMIGSPYFASINAHRELPVERRDDLMMLGFSMLYLIVGEGNLWFSTIATPNPTQYLDEILAMKLDFLK